VNNTATGTKTILCVSWFAYLAESRELLLTSKGFSVESVIGTDEALAKCRVTKVDMLLLGQSVPREEKRRIVEAFRRYSNAPILSLLNAGQEKLPEVEYGIDSLSPEHLVRTMRLILSSSRESN
jgi:DNA-binding response OmpR family regulator